MSVILILILASLGLALTFLAAFVWAVHRGQYEDTCTPAMRVLSESDHSTPGNAEMPLLFNAPLQRNANETRTIFSEPSINL